MSGIFGVSLGPRSPVERSALEAIVADLFTLGGPRSKGSAGIALRNGDGVFVTKAALPASEFVQSKPYRTFWDQHVPERPGGPGPIAIVGHSSHTVAVTHGRDDAHQPLSNSGLVGVHNGLIVNDAALWRKHPECRRSSGDGAEIVLALFRKYFDATSAPGSALRRTFGEIDGVASVALLPSDRDLLILGTNNGSLYYCLDTACDVLLFSSERFTLEALMKRQHVDFTDELPQRLEPNTGLLLAFDTFSYQMVSFLAAESERDVAPASRAALRPIVDDSARAEAAREGLRRCTRCVLPATYPFITFDAAGVCSVCQRYLPVVPLGRDALEDRVAKLRRSDGSPECLVGLSGGRDSAYGLHYVARELKLRAASYTFDDGLMSDTARRNLSRLCGRLGVEHISIDGDLERRRTTIRRNILAWLERPRLGTVPLLFARDKEYFHHGARLAKLAGFGLLFFCPNRLSRTSFKAGFCGVSDRRQWYLRLPLWQKLELAGYFGREILLNPGYLNRSLLETAQSFYSEHVLPQQRFVFLFDYIPWNEEAIAQALQREYDWQLGPPSGTVLGIAEGAAAFEDYIYLTVAGFTEHDARRSNQVREGLLTRERALELSLSENQPRFDVLRGYAQLIGFDFDRSIRVIAAMPKLYYRE